MQLEFDGSRKTGLELVRAKELSEVEDHRFTLIGPDFRATLRTLKPSFIPCSTHWSMMPPTRVTKMPWDWYSLTRAEHYSSAFSPATTRCMPWRSRPWTRPWPSWAPTPPPPSATGLDRQGIHLVVAGENALE